MEFQVGDKVVHWAYGVGEIIQFDEKILAGESVLYYVVQIRDLTVWVPIKQNGKQILRLPTPESEFEELFKILGSAGEQLSSDRLERKTQLNERLRNGTLESICRVIRDLAFHRQYKKLNDNDLSTLERAQNLLLEEWKLALSVSHAEAQQELNLYLKDGYGNG